MRTMKLAPSVFGAGIGNLSQQLKILEENNVELLHVDVMDGHFVEKTAFGPDHIKMLKELTTIPLDVHLMIEKPLPYATTKRSSRSALAAGPIISIITVLPMKRVNVFS